MMTQRELIDCLTNIAELPPTATHKHRTVYQTAHGDYRVDYASYPGESTAEVSRPLIDSLEKSGILVRAFPSAPHVNGWKLAESLPEATLERER